MSKAKGRKGRTIRSQTLLGYFILSGALIFLVALALALFAINDAGHEQTTAYQNQRYQAQEVISAHYKWLEQLSDSITTGTGFSGSLDPDGCALGQWIQESGGELTSDPVMADALNGIIQPHEDIHLTAAELVQQSRTDLDGAYAVYTREFKPKVELIGQGLAVISNRYQEIEQNAEHNMRRISLICRIVLVIMGIWAVGTSVFIGARVSRRITKPILAVEKWSAELASGVDNLQFDAKIANESTYPLEIQRMIASFQEMADGIRDNVRVIQRVAAGDLTAYVDIKSQGDSLGRNLYHLVQNNDMMFADLLRVADSVATNADHIAHASQALASSTITQANAVDVLSGTVDHANMLASRNAESSSQAAVSIEDMAEVVQLGQERMDRLVRSVEDIRRASEQISQVMKSINDIAFQTNILALNAAVEAARAGAAGKGFAVVADEVRNLALKSAEAAEQSRVLIENTINKTAEGSSLADEAGVTFSTIVKSSSEISGAMDTINQASLEQQTYMKEIHEEIKKISAIVVENAASSEETAAATQQMNSNAELIRAAMYKFNLRKRQPGKPYIPPEKAEDEAFVRQAYDNYEKARQSGRSVTTGVTIASKQ